MKQEKKRRPFVERFAFTDPRTGIYYEFIAKDEFDNTIRDAVKKFFNIDNLEEFVQHNFQFYKTLSGQAA